jgi:hypothetical protein
LGVVDKSLVISSTNALFPVPGGPLMYMLPPQRESTACDMKVASSVRSASLPINFVGFPLWENS